MRILHVEAYTIIFHKNFYYVFINVDTTNLDFGVRSYARELDRVGNEVGDNQPQHGSIPVADRKGLDFPGNFSPPYLLLYLRNHLLNEQLEANQRLSGLNPSNSGKPQ